MVKALWLTCAVGIALGALTGIYHLRNQGTAASVSRAEDAEAIPPPTSPRPEVESALRNPPEIALSPVPDESIQDDRPRMLPEYEVAATRFIDTFQPGVAIEDSPPQFVTIPGKGTSSTTIGTLFRTHKDHPTDGWSAVMEQRLGEYLESQPEISTTRALVSCRETRCILQFMELLPSSGERPETLSKNAKAMLLRLRQESWYPDEFVSSSRELYAPVQDDGIQYVAQMLHRGPASTSTSRFMIEEMFGQKLVPPKPEER